MWKIILYNKLATQLKELSHPKCSLKVYYDEREKKRSGILL